MLLKKLYEFCVPFLAHKPQNDYICTCVESFLSRIENSKLPKGRKAAKLHPALQVLQNVFSCFDGEGNVSLHRQMIRKQTF